MKPICRWFIDAMPSIMALALTHQALGYDTFATLALGDFRKAKGNS